MDVDYEYDLGDLIEYDAYALETQEFKEPLETMRLGKFVLAMLTDGTWMKIGEIVAREKPRK